MSINTEDEPYINFAPTHTLNTHAYLTVTTVPNVSIFNSLEHTLTTVTVCPTLMLKTRLTKCIKNVSKLSSKRNAAEMAIKHSTQQEQ